MKVFLVTSRSLPMVGIESCQAFAVIPALEPAFVRQYQGRIITSGFLPEEFPITVYVYLGH